MQFYEYCKNLLKYKYNYTFNALYQDVHRHEIFLFYFSSHCKEDIRVSSGHLGLQHHVKGAMAPENLLPQKWFLTKQTWNITTTHPVRIPLRHGTSGRPVPQSRGTRNRKGRLRILWWNCNVICRSSPLLKAVQDEIYFSCMFYDINWI